MSNDHRSPHTSKARATGQNWAYRFMALIIVHRHRAALVLNVNCQDPRRLRSVALMKLRDFHTEALEFTGRLLDKLDPTSPTPSAIGWSGLETVDHLIAVNAMCADAARQIPPDALGDPSVGGVALRGADESPIGAWWRTAAAVTAAFAPHAADLDAPMPTPLGRPFPGAVVLTQNTLENLIHLCDLDALLDAPVQLPTTLLAEALGRILERPALWQEFRDRGMYAGPNLAGSDASPQERLLAFLGR